MRLGTCRGRQSSLPRADIRTIDLSLGINNPLTHLTSGLGLEVGLLGAEGVRRGVAAGHEEVHGVS